MSYKSEEIKGLEEQCELLQRKLNALDIALITAIDPNAKFSINEQITGLQRQLQTKKTELQAALADQAAQEGPSPAPTPPPPLLHEWHRYTCDRSPQDTRFQGIRQAEARTQFFYLYGLDRHAHQALVERFAFDLEGLLKSHLRADVDKRCRVARALDLVLLLNGDAETCKTEVLASLFTKFGVDPDSHGPLLQTQLAELWRNSPELRGLGSQDRVCCYMGIPEFDWEQKVTPSVVTWLIDEFCGASLPPEAPAFYFFFGIEFEEEDSPVKAEVEVAIRAGGSRVHTLPELGMVVERDLKGWMRTYQKFMPDREQREAFREAVMGGAAEIYMEDLILHLHRIIDQINQPK